MENQSQFSKLSKKHLLKVIIPYLIKNDYPLYPYESAEAFEKCWNDVKTLSSIYGYTPNEEDVEFFSKLLGVNPDLVKEYDDTKNLDLSESLVIPQIKDYDVKYDAWGTCSYTEYYRQTISSYDKSWVKPQLMLLYQEGYWHTGDGEFREQPDFDDYEESDWNITSVEEVSSKKVQENNFKKTSKVISSMDKQSLLELKNIIDSRLRLL